MSLTVQQWRYVGCANISAATNAACLDALYSLGIATTYADTTARTEGAGSAWTWTSKRYQSVGVTECLYPQPPTDTLTQRVLFAGSASAKTPTMWIDTWATATPLIGIVKNAGAFNAWDNASPMTSGSFSGYVRIMAASAVVRVHLYESQECLLTLWETSSGTSYIACAGAVFDPESADTTYDAESDGKLYGLITTGSGGVVDTTFWSWGGTGVFLAHAAGATQCHCGVFTPGSATMLGASSVGKMGAAMTTTGLRSRSGRYAYAPVVMRLVAAAPNDGFIGRAREMYMYSDGIFPTKETSGATVYGYVISGSNGTPCDAIFLKH